MLNWLRKAPAVEPVPVKTSTSYALDVVFQVQNKRTGEELLPNSIHRRLTIEIGDDAGALFLSRLRIEARALIEREIDDSLAKGEKTYEALVGTVPKITLQILSNEVLA